MTAYLVPEVWCDACDKRIQSEGDADGPEGLAEFRAALAADHDWLHEPGTDVDLCPDCQPDDDPMPEPCLAFDVDGPHRPTHNLCSRPKGHDGPHGNEKHDWPAVCHHDPLDLCDRCRTAPEGES